MTGLARLASRSRWWVWVLALAPFLVLAVAKWRTAPPGEITDAYQYVLHARALAEGRGYTDTGYLFSDFVPWVGPAARPPGLPLTLLPIFKLFGSSILLMQMVVFAGTLGFLVLAGRYFARVDSWQLGVSVTLLSGLVPRFPELSMQLLNDLPFCFLFWLTLWVVDSDRPMDLRRVVLVTLLCGAAMAYRLAGVALIPALVLHGLVRFRDRRWVSFVPAAVLGGLGLAALALTDIGIPTWVVGIDWRPTALVAKLGGQVMQYRLGLVESLLYPLPWNLANDIYHLIAASLMLLGLASWLKTAWRSFAVSAAASYGVMLLILPATQSRYLWPLVPLVMFGTVRGFVLVLELLPRKPKLAARHAALVAAGLVGLSTMGNLLRLPPVPPLMDDPATRQVMAWVEPMVPESPRVVFFKPRLLAWETGVPSMALPLVADTVSTEVVLEEFRRQGITHVITHRPETRYLDATSVLRTISDHPELFEEQHRNDTFIAYRFRRAG